MRVDIKLEEGAKMPEKAFESDYCYDVWATSEEEVAPGIWKYGLGLKFDIQRDGKNKVVLVEDSAMDTIHPCPLDVAIDFRPRSSVWKTGMVLSNCEGTIDEGYRGEVCAVFYHVMKDMPRYMVGDKIGQIKLGISLPMVFVECDELSKSERGEKGYGSTGLK